MSTDKILSILGQKKRIEILRVLTESKAGAGVTSLSKELSITAPTVEKHLNILKNIGLVKKQITLEFAKERWVVRGQARVSRLLQLAEDDMGELVEVGYLLEDLEKSVRKIQYYKERGSAMEEREEYRNEATKLDSLLETLRTKELTELLDDDEQKKISYWTMARGMGLL